MSFKETLTFDDVLMVPKYSEILPREVNLHTYITKNIKLNIPLMSAAMDTVTESKMAIALAREGGIGIIHKNLSIADQCAEIDKVKRSESGLILDPVIISSKKSLNEALEIMSKYHISGVPVVDNGRLKGILTNRDIRFETNLDLKVSDRMTSKNLITVEEGTTLDEAKEVLQKYRVEKLLVVNKEGNLTGLITVKDILKKQNYPEAAIDRHGRLLVGAAVGIDVDTLDRVSELKNNNADIIVIDTAHAHSKSVISICKNIKKHYSVELIVGNVATASGAKDLADAGADAIKVGIGPGSICTTRIIAGVGMPQLSAIYECSRALKNTEIPIIADGGIRFSGDIVKGIAAGANVAMLGSLLAGTKETPGDIILYEGRKYKTYRGMGSVEAMEEGTKDRYFQNNKNDSKKLVPEGIVGRVPFKGDVSEVLYQLAGGIKAGMGYTGSKNISELKKAIFVKITSAGSIEGHPHDIYITREAPNYSKN